MAAGTYSKVLEAWVEVVRSTDLVPPSHAKRLELMTPGRALSSALVAHLYDADEDVAFDHLVLRLKRWGCRPTWELVTVTRALVFPTQHVPIRPSVFAQQLEVLDQVAALGNLPNARGYAACQRAAKSIVEALAERGQPPKDLIDVHDFIWDTLRPSVRAQLVPQ
jgi:hypothetical protein